MEQNLQWLERPMRTQILQQGFVKRRHLVAMFGVGDAPHDDGQHMATLLLDFHIRPHIVMIEQLQHITQTRYMVYPINAWCLHRIGQTVGHLPGQGCSARERGIVDDHRNAVFAHMHIKLDPLRPKLDRSSE